ncbi:shikimate dehydrogenase [Herbaspirillum sp. RTI4]|uniref:shikimate dehydrogenase n=1 Tax=Herbaspirillum sp. RTI4 TaxID=3048640 RepID=UPI002AB33E11|nr:shikimate dehydrogenase [Herbaspirillum sp. RTI4]MDY7577537.1 shikimate dehydrogenase [Herbaspirillum sp. RTI4]MEA9981012.1 shikimate dehydrogenase [Herbaspirillum sp. RTI4]
MDLYAVVGNPVAHSKSPEIHAAFAAQTGESMRYERLLAPLDGFAATLQQWRADGGKHSKGVNVTLPFKLEAYALATELSPRAQRAGAVNTLLFDGERIFGDNTDGAGLVADIVRNAGVTLDGKRILLLGAGGAARGALLPLLVGRPRQLVIANRTADKAAQLASQFAADGPIDACDYAALEGTFDLIINATSASLAGAVPPLPPEVFGPSTLAYDMMYASQPTAFMQFASGHGAQVRDGLGMLVEQAAEAFLLWRGVRPQTEEIFTRLRSSL